MKRKFILVNNDLYFVLAKKLVKKSTDTEKLKSQYNLADAILRNGNKYYICMKCIEAEFEMI